MIKSFKLLLILILVMGMGLPDSQPKANGKSPESNKNDQAINLLLSRLDLDQKGLESVRNTRNDPQQAATELLAFYRRRTSVHHPIDRGSKADMLGEVPTEKDLQLAQDAVQHIFVGQPAYPSHFCGTDIDWRTSPVADKEWIWQLNRMYFWDAMGRVYWQTGDEQYAEAWADQVLDWTHKNPRDEDHAYAWRSIETGIRGHRWPGLFQRFIDSPAFTPEVLVAFLNSCYEHAEFLMTQYRTRSNWGLMEAEGMAFIAITFPEFKDAQKWKTEAIRRLNNEINIQVYPDGHQRELAMGYHIGCINWFYRTYELAQLNQLTDAFPDSYLETLEKMCEVPMKLNMPDGTNVPFGDAWMGSPGQHKERFTTWAERFEREDFRYLATEGKAGNPPTETAFALPESGLYSMRSGWDKDAIALVLKCGPDGGGHCQPDNGTFDLYAGGRNLMPDAGSYIYSGDPENRAWFRQTQIHQTLTLNGENSQYAPKLLLWEPGESTDMLVVENASYENLSHRRAVFFVDKRYFVIVDEAFGSDTGEVDIHFQLTPGEAVFDPESLSVASGFETGTNVLVQTQQQPGMLLQEEEGQVSFVYTKKEPRPAFRYRILKQNSETGIRFITLVAPFEGKQPDIQIEQLSHSQPGASNLSLQLIENGKKTTIGFTLSE